MENEIDQCQSQVKKLKEKYKKECAAHKQTEILIKTYESEIKKLELEQEQYEAKVIDHEIHVREYQSEMASLYEKYKRENILHQMTKKRKEIYKTEAAKLELTKSQLKDLREMYEKEFSSHKKSENTIKIYESQAKNFETERLQQELLRSQLKVSKSRKQILKFSFEPKTNENIFVFLP